MEIIFTSACKVIVTDLKDKSVEIFYTVEGSRSFFRGPYDIKIIPLINDNTNERI